MIGYLQDRDAAEQGAAAARTAGARAIAVPGYVTDEDDVADLFDAAAALDRVLPRIPMGRAGEPDEIAPAIGWLLGADSGYVTGASIRIAGGL